MYELETMSEKYEDLPLTNFPVSEDVIERMTDITPTTWPLVAQYNAYFSQGNLSACDALLADNPEFYKSFQNADKYNVLRDGFIAMQRFILTQIDTLYNNIAQSAIGINDNPTEEEASVVSYSAAKIDSLHKKRNITIPVSGWSNSFPYTNTVTVSGLSGDSDLKLLGLYEPANTTADQHKEWTKALGFLMENEDGVTDNAITFKAYKKPTVDFTVITEGG